MRQHVARHVFVDDSGRRRRMTRLIGISLAVLMGAYVVVVGIAFSGVAGSDGLGVPGLGDLSSPADQQVAEVGADPIESPAPTAPVGPTGDASAADETTPTTAQVAGTTTTADPGTTIPATTTTTRPGNSTATPNSTIPDHGPPTSRPSKP